MRDLPPARPVEKPTKYNSGTGRNTRFGVASSACATPGQHIAPVNEQTERYSPRIATQANSQGGKAVGHCLSSQPTSRSDETKACTQNYCACQRLSGFAERNKRSARPAMKEKSAGRLLQCRGQKGRQKGGEEERENWRRSI